MGRTGRVRKLGWAKDTEEYQNYEHKTKALQALHYAPPLQFYESSATIYARYNVAVSAKARYSVITCK